MTVNFETEDNRITRVDRRILLGASLTFFAAVALLLQDQFALVSMRRGEPHAELSIAKVSRSVRDVRRKGAGDVVWQPARGLDPLYQNDSVYSGASSESEVLFSEGSRISIGSDTLVVISRQQEHTKIDLKRGTVTGTIGLRPKLILETGGATQELTGAGARVQIKVGKTGSSSLTVLSGDVELKSAQGKATLVANQTTEVSRTGGIGEVRTYAIELEKPVSDAVLWREPGQRIDFQWKSRDGTARPVVLEVASDAEFSRIVFRQSTEGTSLATGEIPGKGILFWRVRDAALSRTARPDLSGMSPTFRFSSYPQVAPLPVSPSAGAAIGIPQQEREDGPRPSAAVPLQWQDEDGSEEFQVQVSRKESFEGPLATDSRVKALRLETASLEPGRYFWRVRSASPNRPDARWSSASPFEIKVTELGNPPALSGPEDSERIPLFEKEVRIPLKWSRRENTRYYGIEIARDPEFKRIVLQTSAPANSLDWQIDRDGTYYWRVRAVTGSGAVTSYSEPRKFEVIIRDPLDAPEIEEPEIELESSWLPSTHEPEPRAKAWTRLLLSEALAEDRPSGAAGAAIKWREVAGAKSYRIEFSSDKNFDRILESREVPAPPLIWAAPGPGEYFWRVLAINDYGRAGKASRVGRIRVLVAPPKLAAQDLTLSWNGLAAEREVTLQWPRVTGAARYEIEVSRRSDFNRAAHYESAEQSVLVRIAEPGLHYWRVKPVGSGGKAISRFSAPAELRVELKLALDAPAAIAPAEGSVQRIEPADVHPIRLSWRAVAGATSYRLEVARRADFMGDVQKAVTAEPFFELAPEQLGSFVYFWRARAERGGAFSSWSQVARFEVEQIAPQLTLRRPAAGERLRIAPRTPVELAWKPTPGAVDYRLRIWRKPAGAAAAETIETSETSVASVLETGQAYQWEVEARLRSSSTVVSDLREFTVEDPDGRLLVVYLGIGSLGLDQAVSLQSDTIQSGHGGGILKSFAANFESWTLGAGGRLGYRASATYETGALGFAPSTALFSPSPISYGALSLQAALAWRHELVGGVEIAASLGGGYFGHAWVSNRLTDFSANSSYSFGAVQGLMLSTMRDSGRLLLRGGMEVNEAVAGAAAPPGYGATVEILRRFPGMWLGLRAGRVGDGLTVPIQNVQSGKSGTVGLTLQETRFQLGIGTSF